MISKFVIRGIWSRLTAEPAEVWLYPRGDRLEARIVHVEPWIQDALLVGTYTSAVLISDLVDDVWAAEADFIRRKAVA